ncbi:lipocalin family protein [candidate division KSB1 bacterium]
MFKYRPIFTLILCLLLFTLLLPGCKKSSTDSNGDGEHELVGTWRCTSISALGETRDPSAYGLSWTMTFRSNNTFTENFTQAGESDTSNGTWSTSGGNLTINYDEGDPGTQGYSVSGNTLTLTRQNVEVEDGVFATATFEFTKQ